MTLESLIAAANRQGASDLHLEPGLPVAMRVRGTLRTAGEPIAGKTLMDLARDVSGPEAWSQFVERRSADFQLVQGRVTDPSTLNAQTFAWDELQP